MLRTSGTPHGGTTGKRHVGSNLREEKVDDAQDEDGEFTFLSFMKDRRRFAWALLSILKNNIVTAPVYYVFKIFKYIELIFLYIVFALTYYREKTSVHSVGGSFIVEVEDKLWNTLEFITEDITLQVVVLSVVGFLDLAIILALLVLISKFESPEKAKDSNPISKILSFVFQFKSKVLFTLEIILLAHIFKND
jgi:hypothetical protein